MAQKRKERILVFEIRIRVWTDFMEGLFSGFIKTMIYAMGTNSESRGWKTKIEFSERVLDAKTFAEIKKI